MNKNKTHTPGPWRFANGDRFNGGWQEPSECQYLVLAEKETIIASFWDSHGWGDEAKANAHLIAAAPELLAACRLALKVLEQSGMITRELLDADRELRDAIAKADGKR